MPALAPGYRVFHLCGRPVFAAPEERAAVRRAGILRYQPYTAKRLAYRVLVAASIPLGLDRFLSKRVEDPVDRAGFSLPAWLRRIEPLLPQAGASAVLFWPPQNHRDRLYAHLFDAACGAMAFAKIAFDARDAVALEREAAALRALALEAPRLFRVPRVLAHLRTDAYACLVLEALPARRTRLLQRIRFPSDLVQEYSGRCVRLGRAEVERRPWWRLFEQAQSTGQEAFRAALRARLDDGVPIARVHGDFGPHNMLQADDGPWVFDWEESRVDGPALTDELGFHMARRLGQACRRPGAYLRWFGRQFCSAATRTRMTELMAALAYRAAIGAPDALLAIRHWASFQAQHRR